MKTGIVVIQNVIVVLACIVMLAAAACLIFGFRPAIIMSGSMEPEIQAGSLCFYDTKAVYSDIKEGDIIAYRRADINVTHRVSRVIEEGLVTKGDANEAEDRGAVSEYDFLGKTVLWLPKLGRVAAFFKSAAGIISMAVFMIVMILLSILVKDEE